MRISSYKTYDFAAPLCEVLNGVIEAHPILSSVHTEYQGGSPCFCTPERLVREFEFVSSAPGTGGRDIDRIMRVQGIERIRVMREIIRERGNRK